MATLREITTALITLKKDPQGTLRDAWERVKTKAAENVDALNAPREASDLADATHLLDQVMEEVVEMAKPPTPRKRAGDAPTGEGSAT